ncbi:MAG: hypothetical protein ACI92B_002285, partial [Marinobacter maritimus]
LVAEHPWKTIGAFSQGNHKKRRPAFDTFPKAKTTPLIFSPRITTRRSFA